MYQPRHIVTERAAVKDILGPDFPSQVAKVIDRIDHHVRAWIERSPFLVVASSDASGRVDVSPRGDPPGFVKVLDEKTLAVPDRIGNHRGDTFLNVLENPRVGLMFVVPKRREVVRVSGSALIAKDADLLATMEVRGHVPDLALVVRVEEAMFHCGKSMIRSGMWEPDTWGPVDGLPTYAQAAKDHGKLPTPLAEIERAFAKNESDRLY